jgi:Uma2 family endonuclease
MRQNHPRNAVFELVDSNYLEVTTSDLDSDVVINILRFLRQYLTQWRLGRLLATYHPFLMMDESILCPCIAFSSFQNMPYKPSTVALIPPDFAIEVKSPNDKKKDLRLKAQRYLDNGTLLVWLVFPKTQTVEVYDGDNDVVTFGMDDTLTGGDVLPGFTLRVADIFKL